MTIDSQSIVEYLNSRWLSKKTFCFPGPQPVSIERKHLVNLKDDYYIGHKNDGERIALCITRYQDKPRCFLLNRKLELTPINLLLSKKLYQDTILDCELIENNIVLFDCPLFAGESLKTCQFSERLVYLQSFITGLRQRTEDKYSFSVKPFVKIQEHKSLPPCDKTDGYVLVPNKKPVQTGTHNFYYKWKPLLQNTIDFAINSKNQIFLQNAGKLCNAKVEVSLQNLKLDFSKNDIVIVECKYLNDNLWEALQLREDKNTPNSLFTFKKTLINIQEDIQFNELVT